MGVIAIVIVVWGLIVVNRRQNRGSGSYDDDRE
jgi:hypothetical protein